MSGGSLDYAYQKIEDIAHDVARRATTSTERAFVSHLLKLSKALHDLEWSYSGDIGPEGGINAIKAFLAGGAILQQAIADAKQAKADLEEALRMVERKD